MHRPALEGVGNLVTVAARGAWQAVEVKMSQISSSLSPTNSSLHELADSGTGVLASTQVAPERETSAKAEAIEESVAAAREAAEEQTPTKEEATSSELRQGVVSILIIGYLAKIYALHAQSGGGGAD